MTARFDTSVHLEPEREARTSVLRIISVLVRRRSWVVGMTSLFTVTTAVIILLSARTYTSGGLLLPQDAAGRSTDLGGLAAQLGLAVRSQSDQSSQFYADLMQTTTILGPLTDSAFATPRGERRLADVFGIHAGTPAAVREATIARLRDVTGVSVDRNTDVLRYKVTTRMPQLSRDIALRWVGALNDYNVRSRRARAIAEQQFIQERAAQARAALQVAESRLEEFLERNRTFNNDPALVFAHDRLQRDVTVREQVYLTLAQSLEQIAITSARSTPTIAQIEAPSLPAFPNPRGLLWRTLVGLVAGFLFGVLCALAREFVLNAEQQDSRDLEQLRERLVELRRDMRHPVRALSKFFGRDVAESA